MNQHLFIGLEIWVNFIKKLLKIVNKFLNLDMLRGYVHKSINK